MDKFSRLEVPVQACTGWDTPTFERGSINIYLLKGSIGRQVNRNKAMYLADVRIKKIIDVLSNIYITLSW